MLGYFGPAGTFTHQAILGLRGDPRWGALVDDSRPYASVAAALEAVRSGAAEAVMVPIENSVEGGVTATLDNLGDPEAAPLQILAETVVKVTFDLAVRPGTQLGDVKTIITHPHAAAQTRAWLETTLPGATVTERGSTAGAAEAVADPSSPFDAAICAPAATNLYGLTPVAHDIADNDDAVTRFVLVGRRGPCPAPTGHDKTTFVAYMRANHSGALLEILQQLAVRGVNLCRIESRPTKTTLGSYCFSIDAEGHVDDARMSESLMGLKRICQDVVFLGSYPRADEVAPHLPPGADDAAYRAAADWLKSLRK
ncbi:MAG: prephenate dehydratase [Propionibacteriaceae bacterium]|nr:prephenate dehydratase [Propionibacteriaceae bacterium]